MSNFYYCNDCKKPVDLVSDLVFRTNGQHLICKECGGKNWHAIVDSPRGEPKPMIDDGETWPD